MEVTRERLLTSGFFAWAGGILIQVRGEARKRGEILSYESKNLRTNKKKGEKGLE